MTKSSGWDILGRLADLLGVLTPVSLVVLAVLKRVNVVSIEGQDTDLIVAGWCLAVVGIALLFVGLKWRYEDYTTFNRTRRRKSTVALLLSIGLLLLVGVSWLFSD